MPVKTQKIFVHLLILDKNTTHTVVIALWLSLCQDPDLILRFRWFPEYDRGIRERVTEQADFCVQLAFRVDDTLFRQSANMNMNLRLAWLTASRPIVPRSGLSTSSGLR